MNTSFKNSLFLVGTLWATLSLSAQTQTVITVNGTSNGFLPTAGLDYATGDPVTFSFVLPAYGAGQAQGFVSSGVAIWNDDGSPSKRLIQNFTGTGITGTWASPVGEDEFEANTSMSFSSGDNQIQINMEGFAFGDTGLLVNGYTFFGLSLEFASSEFEFATGSGGQTPAEFLAAYLGGPYTPGEASLVLYADGPDESVIFDLSSLTISTISTVPEPSAYAAILGGLTLGVVMLRRQRR